MSVRTSATRCPCVRTGSAPTQRDPTSAPVCRALWPPPNRTSASQRSRRLGSGRRKTETVTVGALASPAPLRRSPYTLHSPFCPFSPQGPGTKPPTVTLKRPNSFPCIQTHTQKHTLAFSTKHSHIPPQTHSRGPRIQCSECMTWDLVFTRYPFALKGFCGLIFFYSVTPGNLIYRYIFHIIFSVTSFFVVLFISST